MDPVELIMKYRRLLPASHQLAFVEDLRVFSMDTMRRFRNTQTKGDFTDGTGDAYLGLPYTPFRPLPADPVMEMPVEYGVRQIDLASLHEWILECRHMLVDQGGPGDTEYTTEVKGYTVISTSVNDDGTPYDNPTDLSVINGALDKLGEALSEFDCLFHDLFDCR